MIYLVKKENNFQDSMGLSQRIDTLRISVTSSCNFRCQYCMPEDYNHQPKTDRNKTELMKSIEWLLKRLQIKNIKLTGGEPLANKEIVDIVNSLTNLESGAELSMTTNGSLLYKYAYKLKSAGLERINISLDTLNPERFKYLTGGALLDKTLEGINTSIEAGLYPIKLNSVLFRSSWREDIPLLLDYAAELNLELRFIELMRTGTASKWAKDQYISFGNILESLENKIIEMETPNMRSPSRKSTIDWHGKLLNIGWISPVSVPFCTNCARIRLDADGYIHRCLMDSKTFPLGEFLNQGVENIDDIFSEYLERKIPPSSIETDKPMIRIGG